MWGVYRPQPLHRASLHSIRSDLLSDVYLRFSEGEPRVHLTPQRTRQAGGDVSEMWCFRQTKICKCSALLFDNIVFWGDCCVWTSIHLFLRAPVHGVAAPTTPDNLRPPGVRLMCLWKSIWTAALHSPLKETLQAAWRPFWGTLSRWSEWSKIRFHLLRDERAGVFVL